MSKLTLQEVKNYYRGAKVIRHKESIYGDVTASVDLGSIKQENSYFVASVKFSETYICHNVMIAKKDELCFNIEQYHEDPQSQAQKVVAEFIAKYGMELAPLLMSEVNSQTMSMDVAEVPVGVKEKFTDLDCKGLIEAMVDGLN